MGGCSWLLSGGLTQSRTQRVEASLARGWRRRARGVHVCLLVLGAALLVIGGVSGCGGSGTQGERVLAGQTHMTSEEQAPASKHSGGVALPDRPSSERSTPSAAVATHTITTADGSVWRVPPVPGASTAPPSSGCERHASEADPTPPLAPPAPGVSAKRTSASRVVVHYGFRRIDPRCRPVALLLTLDVSADGLPGSGDGYPIDGRVGTVIVHVPRFLSDADILSVTALTEDRVTSLASRVRLR
jgi:hypothetical protein